MYQEEIMPHKRRRKKKIPKKASHKHDYVPHLALYINSADSEDACRLGICSICGKTKVLSWLETEPVEGTSYSVMLSYEQILEKYADLPKHYTTEFGALGIGKKD